MPNFVLTLSAPDSYDVETFDLDGDIWAETNATKTTASRYTSDTERGSVMSVQGDIWTLGDGITLGDAYQLGYSDEGAGEGAYDDYTVVAGEIYQFSCWYKCTNSVELTMIIYDQSNGVAISTIQADDSAWTLYEERVTAPSGCTTIRIKFLQKTATKDSGPILIDNVALNESAISQDPDSYSRGPDAVASTHIALSGRRTRDEFGVHFVFELGWEYAPKGLLDALLDLYRSGEILYFDDREVPNLTETQIIYENATEDYVGITNPSSTQKAYYDSSASLPAAEGDFDSNEYSTANYQAVDEDDNNYMETTNPTDGFYLYHHFKFDCGIVRADVHRIRIRIKCLSDDASPANTDGCVLYGWNDVDSAWVELGRTTNSTKQTVEYSQINSTIAQQFIDSSDDYAKFILRSRGARDGANALSLRTYYVEFEVNEGLNEVIEFSHKANLDANLDVVSVVNNSTGLSLALNTDYTIAADRRSITVIGQSSGDEITVEYSRYWEVFIDRLPEEFLSGDPASDRYRGVRAFLKTLSEMPIQ